MAAFEPAHESEEKGVGLMFDSGYPAETMIREVENETNLAFPVSRESYIAWINLCEQLLYSDIICEERTSELPFSDEIDVHGLSFCAYDEDAPRESDIHGIFFTDGTGQRECEHVTERDGLNGCHARYAYAFSGDGKIRFFVPDGTAGRLTFIRYARPVPKRAMGEKVIGVIALPGEFSELMRCKLRAEKYRLMNEDLMCAKWANEYNYHLENFKAFIQARKSQAWSDTHTKDGFYHEKL